MKKVKETTELNNIATELDKESKVIWVKEIKQWVLCYRKGYILTKIMLGKDINIAKRVIKYVFRSYLEDCLLD